MDNHEQQKKIEEITNKMKRMEVENMEFFEAYGTTAKDLLELIRSEEKVPKVLYEVLQRQRQYIEETLARRIDAANAPLTKKESIYEARPGSHWIFVR